MSHILSIRLTKPLAAWVEETSARTGMSQGQLIREHLERARSKDKPPRKFMRLAGIIRGGPRDVSTRKGFSKT